MRCHIGLCIPREAEKCFFVVAGHRHIWQDGHKLLFDQTFEHASDPGCHSPSTPARRSILYVVGQLPARIPSRGAAHASQLSKGADGARASGRRGLARHNLGGVRNRTPPRSSASPACAQRWPRCARLKMPIGEVGYARGRTSPLPEAGSFTPRVLLRLLGRFLSELAHRCNLALFGGGPGCCRQEGCA